MGEVLKMTQQNQHQETLPTGLHGHQRTVLQHVAHCGKTVKAERLLVFSFFPWSCSTKQFSACKGGREQRPRQLFKPTLCFPVQLRALLYRLREGADHVGRLCGCGRGTEEGAGLVPLMISEIRGN